MVPIKSGVDRYCDQCKMCNRINDSHGRDTDIEVTISCKLIGRVYFTDKEITKGYDLTEYDEIDPEDEIVTETWYPCKCPELALPISLQDYCLERSINHRYNVWQTDLENPCVLCDKRGRINVVRKYKDEDGPHEWLIDCHKAKCGVQIPTHYQVFGCPRSPVRCLNCTNAIEVSPLFVYNDRYEVRCKILGNCMCTINGTCEARVITRWRKLVMQ